MKKLSIATLFVGCMLLNSSADSQTRCDSALHRREIFSPATYKLTKAYTETNWGTQLFVNNRVSIMQYFTWDPYDEITSCATFHLDHGWNRMIYEEYGTNWIRAYGSKGTGVGNFLFPKSFDVVSYCDDFINGYWYGIYIVDTGNDRLIKLRYYYQTEEVVWQYAVHYDYFESLFDINVYNGGTHAWQYDDYILVLDGWRIRRLEENGTPNAPAYGVHGCQGNMGEFCSPTALVCGRSYIPENPSDDPNADNDYLYVADPGNDRIVWLEINYMPGMDPWATWLGEVSLGGRYISDLEVDNYGQVWATDRDNGCLIKYTYDLVPLCTYGTTGAGEHQFFWPLGASCAGGYWGCGNLMVTESWSDTSGLQFFDIGTDIVDFSVWNSTNNHWNYISYTLIDPSRVSVKVLSMPFGWTVKTIRKGMEISGQSFYVWDGSNDKGQMVGTGMYCIQVSDTSSYYLLETGKPAYCVRRTSNIFYHAFNPYTNYIPGDVNNDRAVNNGDVVYMVNYVFKGGPQPQPYLCVGEVNGDIAVNAGDVVYLTNYVFKNGSAPQDGCQTWPD